jgi:rod shape-determining protein MreC
VIIRLSPARRVAIQRVSFPLLLLVSVIMIALGKSDQVGFESLRDRVMDVAAPTLEVLSRPASLLDAAISRARDFVGVYRTNAQLTAENERLLIWQQAALRLASENAELRDLLKLVPEASNSFVTARIIANSGGAYVRSVMVNAGRNNGVFRGQAAITGDGLVGRVTEVGNGAARVLLITDLNSRIPVIVEASRRRAILTGDNSERPSLLNFEAGPAPRIGDRIVTSGQGGVFPPGLPVGTVVAVDSEMARVEPYAALSRVEYLRLVDYGLGEALPNPLALAPGGAKRPDQSLGPPVHR